LGSRETPGDEYTRELTSIDLQAKPAGAKYIRE
jgi:hypothetical protein